MAMTLASPDTSTPDPDSGDLVSFDEAAILFKETQRPEFQGRTAVVVRKLQRWAQEDQLGVTRRGRAGYVSFSDLLEAHGRRYPAPPTR